MPPTRKDQRTISKWQKQDRAEQDAGLQLLLSDPNGRKFLFWYLSACHLYRNPFSADPQLTAFACGELNAGQTLLARITEVNADAYLLMLKENQDVERTRAEQTGNDSGKYGD